MDERRKFVRLNFDVDVAWKKIPPLDSSNPHRNSAKNISEGGICLITNEPVAVGDTLDLVIKLPAQNVINAQGKVVWASEFEVIGATREKKYDAGVEFIQIRENEQEEIKKFVLRHLTT